MKGLFAFYCIWLTFFPVSKALAGPADNKFSNLKVLISVGQYQGQDVLWAREFCAQSYKSVNNASREGIDIGCRQMPANTFADHAAQALRPQYDYHLIVLRDPSRQEIDLRLVNWRSNDGTDFESVGWTLKETENDRVSWKDGLGKILTNMALYLENQGAYKQALFYQGLQESTSMDFDIKTGVIKDKLTGLEMSYPQAYDQFKNESPRKRNWLRSMSEIGVLLAGGLAVYYKNLVFNKQDFDYSLGEGIKKKFITGEAVRFDDNDKYANGGHALAGVLYQQVARSNGFSSLESLAVAVASSTVWEGLEYHEVLSINDQIITGLGGWVIGESAFQMGCALLSKNELSAKVAGTLLNPNTAFNRLLERKRTDKSWTDECKNPRWSQISVYMGQETTKKPFTNEEGQKAFLFGFDGTVIRLPEYGTVGQGSGTLHDTAMSHLKIESSGGDFRLLAQVVSAALYQRQVQRDSKGELQGYEFILGVGSGVSYNDRGTELKDEFYGAVHLFGPTAHVVLHHGGFKVTAEVSVYGDFAMVKSYALEKYAEANGGLAGNPTVVQKRGYYWGLGSTTMAMLSVDWNRWQVGVEAESSSASIINRRNRYQESVTKDEKFRDSYARARVWIAFRATKRLRVEAAVEKIVREGSINGDYRTASTETRKMIYLKYMF
jgi:hypothetical protein